MFDFIEVLRGELPRFKKVLELGSKDGKDLLLLHEYYEVVASEDTKLKTRALKDEFIDIRVILLEPISMDTHKKFDCIFSRNLYDDLDELKGKILGCWCKPNKCHGDVLIKLLKNNDFDRKNYKN